MWYGTHTQMSNDLLWYCLSIAWACSCEKYPTTTTKTNSQGLPNFSSVFDGSRGGAREGYGLGDYIQLPPKEKLNA